MKPTTIVRFTHELLSLHHDFGINLATATQKELLNHLDTYSKTHKSNSYRVHCVIIKHALKMSCLNRTDLAEKIILPRRVDPEATVKTIPREERERLIHEAPLTPRTGCLRRLPSAWDSVPHLKDLKWRSGE
jgi:hypothetical protein